MPQLGVGTSTLKETAAECVKHAIGLGYRLADAAQGYDNEAEVWYGIKESGIGLACEEAERIILAERYASRSTGLLKHSGERMLT